MSVLFYYIYLEYHYLLVVGYLYYITGEKKKGKTSKFPKTTNSYFRYSLWGMFKQRTLKENSCIPLNYVVIVLKTVLSIYVAGEGFSYHDKKILYV